MKRYFDLISPGDFCSFFREFSPLDTESVSLENGLSRVSALDIEAPSPLPPFSRSTMDGFAVRARDTFGCSDSEPALLELAGEIAMGESGRQITLEPGQAVRIWTGGSLPRTSDSVVMVEYTRLLDDTTIEVFRPVAPGENVTQAGEDFAKGQIVLERGRMLRPQDLGVLAGLGITELSVFRRPVVSIISTGDELVEPDQQPEAGRIRDINSITLSALVRETGGIPVRSGIVKDDFTAILSACRQALDKSDMVLLSGGSSVGSRDYTLDVFKKIDGSRLLAHGVALRPGKPTILAAMENRAIYGLPGHAASSMVIFYLLVRPLLRHYMGLETDTGLHRIQAITSQPIPSSAGRQDYIRIRLEWQVPGRPPLAFPVYGKSGLLSPLVRSDGLLVIDRDSEGLDSGSLADVLLFP